MASDSAPVHVRGPNAERRDAPLDGEARRADRERGETRPRSGDQHRHDSPTDRTHACPLCGYTDETKASVHTHLQLSHRKRAISSALLEAYAGIGSDSDPAEPESAPAVED